MPIYELACKECSKEYERIVSFSSTVLPACPTCGSVEVMRLLSKPAIHFKGSGWYITDSKKEDEKKKAAAQKADSNGAASEKSAKSQPRANRRARPKSGDQERNQNGSQEQFVEREQGHGQRGRIVFAASGSAPEK